MKKYILETPQGTASDSFSMDAWSTVDAPTSPDILIIEAESESDAIRQAQEITGQARYSKGSSWETGGLHSFSVRTLEDALDSYADFILTLPPSDVPRPGVWKATTRPNGGGPDREEYLENALERAEEKRYRRGDAEFSDIAEALSYLEDGTRLSITPA